MDDTDHTDLESALLSEMVETVGVGVAIYGESGRYRYVNEAYADILGTDRSSLLGMAIWEVIPAFERDRFEDYWDSFEEGETRVADTEHIADGVLTPVSTLTTRRRIGGRPYNFGTIRDRTERQRRERELREKNERLEAFAGTVSHDLRNPLNVAKGYLDLLRSDVDHDAVEPIGRALGRMEVLIDDLLTLAREGRSVSDTESVSLSAVVDDAWRQIQTREAVLEGECDGSLLADRGRLQQLLENLFRNTVEHADAPATVRVGFLGDGEGFFVADDGPGIPEPERDQVFEPTYSTDEGGTGFGLAIVDEVAAAHGWSVSVTDSADGGARFEFRGVDVPDDT
ncbi:HAMP domain-containing sensor histidine kinase [Natronomonas sp. LN261]|uniref:sensor histidine kinase n=1 Tax=Natronomonas sp. LN261 TaxID=2750669 RepID=UPI0015EEA3D7|nr:PAS domain-containing sensor histidine kinase [Natronomonas sp. LN261]